MSHKDILREFKEKLSKLNLEAVWQVEERLDRQFLALKELFVNWCRAENRDCLPDKEISLIKLVIMNSVISYQLSDTAENWWSEFSEYFITSGPEEQSEIPELISTFLGNSKSNRRLRDTKLKRLRRLWSKLEPLEFTSLKRYYENMLRFRDWLSEALNSKPYRKTIVFTVKMFGYIGRIVWGYRIPYPYQVDIPLDSRILKVSSKLFGLPRLEERKILDAWKLLAVQVSVPPLHIDSLIWLSLGFTEDEFVRLLGKLDEPYRKPYYELYQFLHSLPLSGAPDS